MKPHPLFFLLVILCLFLCSYGVYLVQKELSLALAILAGLVAFIFISYFFFVFFVLISSHFNGRYHSKLQDLSEKINDVTKGKEDDINWELACKDLVNLLNFDYAIISFVNFETQKIESKYFYLNPEKEAHLKVHFYNELIDENNQKTYKSWIDDGESSYEINSHETEKDIVLRAALENEIKVLVANREIPVDKINDRDTINFFVNPLYWFRYVMASKNSEVEVPQKINNEIYEKYQHIKLGRVFIPITFLNSKHQKVNDDLIEANNDEEINNLNEAYNPSFPVGVIELGIKNEKFEKIAKRNLKDDNSFLLREFRFKFVTGVDKWVKIFNAWSNISPVSLRNAIYLSKLYADNLAQVYFEKEKIKQERDLLDKLATVRNLGNNDYKNYGEAFLETVRKKIGADWGVAAFRNFNVDYLSYRERALYHKKPEKEIFKTLLDTETYAGISSFVLKYNRPYLMTQKENKFYVNVFQDSVQQSEVIVPLTMDGQIMGVISFSSRKKGIFNLLTVHLLERVSEEFRIYYFRKKRYNILANLSKPEAVWINKDEIIKKTGELLEQFYISNYVLIWEFETVNYVVNNDLEYNRHSEFRNVYISDGFSQISPDFENLKNCINHDLISSALLTNDSQYRINLSDSSFEYEQFLAEKFKIKSYFVIKVQGTNGVQMLICIHSRRGFADETYEAEKKEDSTERKRMKLYFERDKDFLAILTNRLSLSLQNQNVLTVTKDFFNAFENMSNIANVSSHKEGIFQLIVDAALRGCNADGVSLYLKTNDGNDILTDNGIHRSSKGQYYIRPGKSTKAIGANAIIKLKDDEDVYSFLNDDEYEKFLLDYAGVDKISSRERKNSFWTKNKIKSSFAIKIYQNNKENKETIGVLYFNFKKSFIGNKLEVENHPLVELMKTFARMVQIVLLSVRGIEDKINELLSQQQELKKTIYSLDKKKEELEIQKQDVESKLDSLLPQAAKSTFYLILETVNHDVRNLLFGLNDSINDILRRNVLKGKDLEYFEYFSDRSKYINNNIAELLELFNFNKQRKEFVDINKIILQIAQYFDNQRDTSKKRIRFNDKLSPKSPEIRCVKTELTMIIYNLFMNATQAIDASNKSHGNIEFSTTTENGLILFRLTDNGVGIKDDVSSKIYDPHFTTKDEGLGIGLYFVKILLESDDYHGTINHYMDSNRLTNFQITIPSFINSLKS